MVSRMGRPLAGSFSSRARDGREHDPRTFPAKRRPPQGGRERSRPRLVDRGCPAGVDLPAGLQRLWKMSHPDPLPAAPTQEKPPRQEINRVFIVRRGEHGARDRPPVRAPRYRRRPVRRSRRRPWSRLPRSCGKAASFATGGRRAVGGRSTAGGSSSGSRRGPDLPAAAARRSGDRMRPGKPRTQAARVRAGQRALAPGDDPRHEHFLAHPLATCRQLPPASEKLGRPPFPSARLPPATSSTSWGIPGRSRG